MTTSDWTQHPALVEFYSRFRSRPEDLYPSERRFLPWVARQSTSVLDTGCAAGGFSNIWRHYRPDISYVGVDVSASLIDAARRLHPDVQFIQANLTGRSELPDGCAVTVQSLGWLCWEPEYLRAIPELWRLAGRYLLLDLRLVEREEEESSGRQRVEYSRQWDGTTTTPYLTVAWPRVARLILDLHPRAVYAYGYWGKPAETVDGVAGDVCFAVLLLEKPSLDEIIDMPTVCVDMPLAWPAGETGAVRVLPGAALAELIPPDGGTVQG